MAKYKNFFETIEEALMRLKSTIVLYDGDPYYVWTITNHKSDGAFRIYMTDLQSMQSGQVPPVLHQLPHGHTSLGASMDMYVDGPNKINGLPVVRKKMDSPLFKQYRPFPLGMMNHQGNAVYIERSPNRPKTEQGLTPNQLRATAVKASASGNYSVNVYCPEFRDCIKGDYPTPNECLKGITSGKNVNESVAFNRNFALVKGPIGTLFLGYKNDVVGLLPQNDFKYLTLGNKFKHCKEAVSELNLFYNVT